MNHSVKKILDWAKVLRPELAEKCGIELDASGHITTPTYKELWVFWKERFDLAEKANLTYCPEHNKMLPCRHCAWRKKKKPGSIRNRKKQQSNFAARAIDGEKSWAGSSSIIAPGRTTNAQRVKHTPEWVNNDAFIQELLLDRFPNWRPTKRKDANPTHLKRAALWFQIIQLWWRLGWPEGDVVEQINEDRSAEDQITPKKLHDTIRRIRKAVAGMTTSGKTRRNRPMGRPRKQALSDGPDDMEV